MLGIKEVTIKHIKTAITIIPIPNIHNPYKPTTLTAPKRHQHPHHNTPTTPNLPNPLHPAHLPQTNPITLTLTFPTHTLVYKNGNIFTSLIVLSITEWCRW